MFLNQFHNTVFKFFWVSILVISLLAVPLSTAGAAQSTGVLAQGNTAWVFFSPAQATLPPNTTFGLQIDAGFSQIVFAQIDLTFDPTLIQLAGEIQTTSLLRNVIQKTSKANANATGHIVITLALPPGDVPPTGLFEFAQLPFRAVTTLPNQSTTISVNDQNVQIVEIGATELPILSEPAVIYLNSAPLPSAEFDAWPQSGDAPLDVEFHIVDTSNITSCAWNYGDGQTSTSCALYHTHTYTNPDSYSVTLIVTGPGGSDQMTRSNYVNVMGPSVTKVVFKSAGAPDGWVLENSETGNQGGYLNAAESTFLLGDDAGNRQYRSILHFNTSSLPDNAVITDAFLKIKRESGSGSPFSTHRLIAVDIHKGPFSNNPALQVTDFQAVTGMLRAGFFTNNPYPGGWYLSNFKSAAHPYINLTGSTQFRLRFQLDDDNDAVADHIRFYSGNATPSYRPVLVIEYFVP
jgi:PKD repeat protein